MYHLNLKLNSRVFVPLMITILLLANAVGAQTQTPSFRDRLLIKRGDTATVEAQALAAFGLKADHEFPPFKFMRLSERPSPTKKIRGWFHQPETPGQQKAHAHPDNLLTIPHWSDEFTYHGLTYKYKIVGTDPKHHSAATIIPTVLIPIRFRFENGLVIDANADSIDGHTSIEGIFNSPIFQAHDFYVGGTSIGNTQYGDAFQRANFWDSVSRNSHDYHVLLDQPEVTPAFEVFVSSDKVDFVTDPGSGTPVPLIAGDLLVQATESAILQANVSTQTLPIVVWGNVLGQGFGAFHGAFQRPDGAQTYIATGYHPRGPSWLGAEDVFYLSHEVIEWINDPFEDNFTPGWDFPETGFPHCFSVVADDRLEVADPLSIYLDSDVPVDLGAVTYHLADGVFLDYFTRRDASRSVNGQYDFFGQFPKSPSAPCAGHVEVEMISLEYPNATRTRANGISNSGWVVGDFTDAANRIHGFVFDGRHFAQLDYPGAVTTVIYKLSDAGQAVGYYADTGGLLHGFSYSHGIFRTINVPSSLDNTSFANGNNSRGDVVGEYDLTEPITHGFIDQNGQFQAIDTPFNQQTEVEDINDFDLLVGDTYDDPFNGPVHGFLLDRGVFTQFDFPGATLTAPLGVNNRGEHGGFFIDQFGHDGYVTIYGYPYQVFGDVHGINDRRQIVGSKFELTSCDNSGFCLLREVGYIATLPQ